MSEYNLGDRVKVTLEGYVNAITTEPPNIDYPDPDRPRFIQVFFPDGGQTLHGPSGQNLMLDMDNSNVILELLSKRITSRPR